MAGIANDDFLEIHQGDRLHFTIGTQPSWVLSANDGNGVDKLKPLSLGSVTSGPSNGNLSRVGPYGGISYKPNDGFVGQDFFTYQISDKAGNTGTALVTIDVTNTAPTAADDSYFVTHDRALVIDRAAGLLTNDSDSDGDRLSVELDTGPANGTLTYLRPNGSFEYVPNAGYVASDSFTYKVFDGAAYATAEVTINVTNAAATDIHLSNSTVEENKRIGTLVGKLSAMDADPGDSATFSLVAGDGDADNGSFTIDGNRLKTNAVFDYEVSNEYSIRIRATDELGATSDKVFTISIGDVNDTTDISVIDAGYDSGSFVWFVDYTIDFRPAIPFDIVIYDSPDGVAKGATLATLTVVDPADLKKGDHSAFMSLGNLPSSLYIIAEVDVYDVIAEPDESNNTLSRSTPSIEEPIDFDVTLESATSETFIAALAEAPAAASWEFNEGDDVTYFITLSRAASQPITIHYSFYDMEAVNGSDYTAINGSVTFAAGQTRLPVPLFIIDDATSENYERFLVVVEDRSGQTRQSSVTRLITITPSDGFANPTPLKSTSIVADVGYAQSANEASVIAAINEGARVMGQLGFMVRFNRKVLKDHYSSGVFGYDTTTLESGFQRIKPSHGTLTYLIRQGILAKPAILAFTNGPGGSRYRNGEGVIFGLNNDPIANATQYGRELAHELIWHYYVHGDGHPNQGKGDLSEQTVNVSARTATHEKVLQKVANEIKVRTGVDVPPTYILP